MQRMAKYLITFIPKCYTLAVAAVIAEQFEEQFAE